MNVLRLCRLDDAGRIVGPPEVIEVELDKDAVTVARGNLDGTPGEVWRGVRLI